MNTKYLKVAVVGLGNMGQHHAKAYTRLDQVDFVSACDPHPERFESVETQESTQYFSDIHKMLASVDIDAVSICVPTSMHYEVAKLCMDHNICVLVEKPIAESVSQAKLLVQHAKDQGVLLTVGHIERFNPAVLKAKDFVSSGKLGDIHAIQCKRYGPFPKQIKDANVLVDVAVHDIDIVQFLLQAPVLESKVFTHHVHSKERADTGHVMLTFEPNIRVNIHVSWAFPYKQREVEIIGSKGVALVDCIAQSMTVYPVDIKVAPDEIYLPLAEGECIEINKKEPIIEECRAFVDAVLHKTAPFICPEQATEALHLALLNGVGRR
jgi:UDP-N-acetylglucosamine 3-dehydrogenase